MTDKELLVLAAKAIGKKNWQCSSYCGLYRFDSEGVPYWNPLEHDGDAFKLAVKLGILHKLFICDNGEKVVFGDEFTVYSYETGYDTCAAVRLAIVLAAAKIGMSL